MGGFAVKVRGSKQVDSGSSISGRFRLINVIIFMFASILIISTTVLVLRSITDTVARDYARLYSTNTSRALGAHLNREIALMQKAARSEAVIQWFTDEFNDEKKAAALAEMQEVIDALYSDNIYLAIENSFNEYTIGEDYTPDDVVSHASLTPGYYDDAWYFECLEGIEDYVLNVDIDKLLLRKLVWINHKVLLDGVPVGCITSGLEFSSVAEELLGEYDNTKVRGVIIDADGIVQMDSISLGENSFLRYEEFYPVAEEFTDPVFVAELEAYLQSIDRLFDASNAFLVELSSGPYRYATIAPIQATDWSVITFYNSSSLFNLTKLTPLYIVMLLVLIGYALIGSFASYRLLFRPIDMLVDSLGKTNENPEETIYGVDRGDEIGELAQTIQDMKNRLDSYNTDLEQEVEARSAALRRAYDQTREQHQIILSGIDYASNIQRHMFPRRESFEQAFSDYSVMWKPRDMVGGDIYWLKPFEGGSLLCVCDCTGHGTSGALLTMLTVSVLDTVVDETNYKDTANVIWEIEKRFMALLEARSASIQVGCDLAVLYIDSSGEVTISSANTHVFICDGTKVDQIKGQRLYLGEGMIQQKETIESIIIPANSENIYYIASDGLYDQIGGDSGTPFGYRAFMQIILEHHHEGQPAISRRIWEAFEAYRGEEARRDDMQLITFRV